MPDGIDATPLQKWIPKPQSSNIRAPGWLLATGTRACWRCDARSHVFYIVLPPGYEALIVEDDPADDHWGRGKRLTLLSYVMGIAEPVAAQLQRLAPRYRVDYSQTTHSFYWMNHCEHCEAKLGDFETLKECAAFQELGELLNSGKPGAIELQEIAEPFIGSCGSHTA